MSVRDLIRKHASPRIGTVDLDGQTIHVRAFSGAGRAHYTDMVRKAEEAKTSVEPHEIAALGICEEDGTLAYDLSKPEDVAELKSRDGKFLADVSMKLFELSGLTAKAEEEAAKNSNASPNDDSGSGSQPTSSTAASPKRKNG
jgi:hypothetical protein